MTSQPFNGPDALIADEQATMRDAPLADLERWEAERTHVFAGAGYRTVRAQAARAELERRGMLRTEYDDEAVLRIIEREVAKGVALDSGHLIGIVMREMKGRANPAQVLEVARAVLRGAPIAPLALPKPPPIDRMPPAPAWLPKRKDRG